MSNLIRLDECCSIELSSVDKKSKPNEQKVKLCNFTDVYYNWNIYPSMVNEFLEATASNKNIDTLSLKRNDVVITKDSETRNDIGMSALIYNDLPNTVLGYHCALIRPNNLINGGYLNAYLNSNLGRKYFENQATGSGQRYTLTKESIGSIKIPLISIKLQNDISDIFNSIDRKIINNNKIISNLESLAKTIYDYWFLQFEFPNEEGKPYKSSGGKMDWNDELKREIPEGWRYEELQSKICLTKGISYTSKNIVTGEGIPMINLASIDINRNYKPNELKYFDGDVNESKKCKTFDLLIACTDLTRNADIIGSPILVTNDYDEFTYSMDLVKLETHDNNLNPLYLYGTLRTDFYHNYIKGFASGTNVLHLNTKGIEWYKCVIPTMNIQNKYSDLIKNIHLKKCELIKENQELASLRDFLLPMLMNGQVTFRV